MRLLVSITIVCSSLFLALFHREAYSYVPLVIVLTFFISTYVLHQMYRKTSVTVRLVEQPLHKAHVELHFDNKHLQLQGQYTIVYEHVIEKERKQISELFTIKKNQNIEVTLPIEYCGQVEITSVLVTLHDPLNFYSTELKVDSVAKKVFLPQKIPVETMSFQQVTVREIGHDAGAYERIIPYMPGDAVQHIHWAISAKLQTVMVQKPAYALSTRTQFALYFNDIQTVSQYDYFMNYCYSLLQQDDIEFVAIWQGDWRTVSVQSSAEVERLFYELLTYSLPQLYASSLPASDYNILRYEGAVLT